MVDKAQVTLKLNSWEFDLMREAIEAYRLESKNIANKNELPHDQRRQARETAARLELLQERF